MRAGELRVFHDTEFRPIALSCLKCGLHGEAWRLYFQTFLMNLRLLRLRFLGAFLLLGFYYWLRRLWPPAVSPDIRLGGHDAENPSKQ
jgi:hypothetical protein